MLLSKALEVGEELVAALRDHPSAMRVELAGSARRMADAVQGPRHRRGHERPGGARARRSARCPRSTSVHSSGEAGARAVTHSGLPVDLRIVPEEAFGNLLQHFTGSGKHNEALRTEAVQRGLHVSEYGIADDESGETMACATEEEVYERLGMQYIPPELRENRGELAAARKGELPEADRAGRHPRRPAHAHHRLGRPRARSRRWPRPRASAATSTWRSPTTRPRTASATTSRPTSCCARSSAIRGAARSTASRVLAGHREQRAARRLARLRRRRARAARLGGRQPAHLVPACRRRSRPSAC